MDIKELKGKTITIEDIQVDSDGDLTIIGRGPTEIKTLSDPCCEPYSYPAHQRIIMTFIAHGDTYTRCGDLDERSHLESYFDEWEIDEEEE